MLTPELLERNLDLAIGHRKPSIPKHFEHGFSSPIVAVALDSAGVYQAAKAAPEVLLAAGAVDVHGFRHLLRLKFFSLDFVPFFFLL